MFSFRAMNTNVAVTSAANEERVAAQIAEVFWLAELRFSRFREDSELSRLNRARQAMRVSQPLFDALSRARGYVELTGGVYDPGIGGALIAQGYDRSFSPGGLDRAGCPAQARAGSLLDLKLDPSSRSVERPAHVLIDLGGMIKGSTVDASTQCLDGAGAVDAGGDAAMRGPSPTGGAWLVDVEDPTDSSQIVATIEVSNRAVATSAANRRKWLVGATTAHHLIDPRTQSPAVTDLAQVTVIADSAELADVLAKAVFVLGEREGRRFLLEQTGVGAVLVGRDGHVSFAGDVHVREVMYD